MKHNSLPKSASACLSQLSPKFQSKELFKISSSNYCHLGHISVCVKGGKNIAIVSCCSMLNVIQGPVLNLTSQPPEVLLVAECCFQSQEHLGGELQISFKTVAGN